MTLQECIQEACKQVGQIDANSLNYARGRAALRYKFIWDFALWQDSKILIGFTQPATAAEVVVPSLIERVIGVRIDNKNVSNVQLENIFQLDPAIFEQTGQPLAYSNLSEVATPTSPDGSTLTLFSESGEDIGKKVLIRGQRDGALAREEITLNGVAPIVTANGYDVVEALTKEETSGALIVRRTEDNVSLVTLFPYETQRKHPRLRLFRAPTSPTTLLVLGKRRSIPLTSDLDAPAIRGIDNAWLAYVTGDMLERRRQYGKAQSKFSEGQGLLQVAIDAEVNQATYTAQIVPEPYEGAIGGGDYGEF